MPPMIILSEAAGAELQYSSAWSVPRRRRVLPLRRSIATFPASATSYTRSSNVTSTSSATSTTRSMQLPTACSGWTGFGTWVSGFWAAATTAWEWRGSDARTPGAVTAETASGFCRQNARGVLQTTFRPFSCKGFYLCPSCSQKRTLLFSEHLTNKVLLELPHRRFVFTMPKALRPFFRHDRRLFADVSRLIYAIIREFYAEAAGRPLLTGLIIAHSKTPKASVVRRPIAM